MKKAFVLVITFLIIVGFIIYSGETAGHKIKYVRIAGQDIKVELAVTPAEQERGLSGRIELKEDEGMLFVFTSPDKYRFWMKDMNFPIDMVWLDENLKVVYIKKDARPESYPQTYGPASPSQGGPDTNAKYVLEVIAGFADKNNLQVGEKVEFTY